jgi:Phosphotransferase system, mannose/fructose/N-acetylgalactosamine-specific component IIB
MVLKGPEVLLKLWNYGFHMESVTIGNMSNHPGTKQLRRTINVTDQDIEDFKELSGKNVKLNVQMVPSDEIINFMSLIK